MAVLLVLVGELPQSATPTAPSEREPLAQNQASLSDEVAAEGGVTK